MTFRLPPERVPEDQPWRDRDFLRWAYHERGLSPRTIAYELGTEVSRVTVHMERLGVLRPWRHEPTLRRLYVEQGLSADEIAARDGFDCSPTTVRKYLAEYGLTDENADEITYGRLDELGSESPVPTA
ncbi:hypothetical protein AMS69_17350 [Haloarcula rubripromontorii]|uniref:Uncharacterized protein n=1 Tax=Haloarcula rubripromontorii TaxID=1705562 RepID=A0A0N0BMW4_9EURY|nr:hypothetical protein [Haloarcula rubripromontorii]KOX91630.1 hypothetical protein AMS69_17350 [Haloarcula rubripromontorii]